MNPLQNISTQRLLIQTSPFNERKSELRKSSGTLNDRIQWNFWYNRAVVKFSHCCWFLLLLRVYWIKLIFYLTFTEHFGQSNWIWRLIEFTWRKKWANFKRTDGQIDLVEFRFYTMYVKYFKIRNSKYSIIIIKLCLSKESFCFHFMEKYWV